MSADTWEHHTRTLAERPSLEILRSVQASCTALNARVADLGAAHYQSFVELMPAAGQSDENRARTVSECWVTSVLWAALSGATPDTVEEVMSHVGGNLRRLGLAASGFHIAGVALLRSVRTLQSDDWGSAQSSRWVSYIAWLTAHAAAGAAAVATAAPPLGTDLPADSPFTTLGAPRPQDAVTFSPDGAQGKPRRRRAGPLAEHALDLLSELWCGLPRLEADRYPEGRAG